MKMNKMEAALRYVVARASQFFPHTPDLRPCKVLLSQESHLYGIGSTHAIRTIIRR